MFLCCTLVLLEHRIDPENLAANNLLISDFGLAHEIQHTTRVSGAGTYAWMAPEALMSTVSKGSDVWRLVYIAHHKKPHSRKSSFFNFNPIDGLCGMRKTIFVNLKLLLPYTIPINTS